MFNRKLKKNNKIKIKLINDVIEIEKVISTSRLFSISKYLNEIINILDDCNLIIDSISSNKIINELNKIKMYSFKEYEEYLKSICKNIISILKKDLSNDETNVNLYRNEVQINKMMGIQKELSNQIDEISEKMKDALGKDKSLWLMLNMKRNLLYKKMAIITKNYNAYLNMQCNLELVNEVNEAKENTEDFLEQFEIINYNKFTDDVNYISKINDEVYEVTDKINECFVQNFNNNDDSLYEKILEEKIINENNKKSNLKSISIEE